MEWEGWLEWDRARRLEGGGLTLRMAGRRVCARRRRLLRSCWKPRSSMADAW